MAEDRRVYGIRGDWSTAAIDRPWGFGTTYSTVREGGCGYRLGPRGRGKREEATEEEAVKGEVESATWGDRCKLETP